MSEPARQVWSRPAIGIDIGGTKVAGGVVPNSAAPSTGAGLRVLIVSWYQYAESFQVRERSPKSTRSSPKRLEKPCDHSKLSISDHTM